MKSSPGDSNMWTRFNIPNLMVLVNVVLQIPWGWAGLVIVFNQSQVMLTYSEHLVTSGLSKSSKEKVVRLF